MSSPNAIIDHLFADFSLPGVPGVSVMVIRNGEEILTANYGLANLETAAPCLGNTNYRLASVTKEFTAMAVMILAERGKLSLDDHLPKFFPGFPQFGNAITVRHLLTHTSGLLAYEDLIPAGTTVQVKDHDVVELLRRQDKTMFPPGGKFHYSNTGYAFLAMIAQTVSGVSFAQFLHDNIFQPIGMHDTVAYEAGISTVPHRALGYSAVIHKDTVRRAFEMTDQSLTSAVLGDGGIYSSIKDMFHWDQALYTEKLISRKMLRQAFTASSASSDFKGSGYGFGWYVGQQRGVPCVWHYGGTCGFSTHIERYPERQFSLIMLCNRREAPLADLSRAVADAYWK